MDSRCCGNDGFLNETIFCMATYIIGDVQGCYRELQLLLEKINFNPNKDTLGFVGDLINRGPHSLEVLRFIKQLPNAHVVLGNHDIFALILGYGLMPLDAYPHTFHELFKAPDKYELLDWLRAQPLIKKIAAPDAVLVHAGIPPQWSIDQALNYAHEVHEELTNKYFLTFLRDSFGNHPTHWNENLIGMDRLRYITNALTRMRLCTENGDLEFDKQDKTLAIGRYRAWFTWRDKTHDPMHIYFGHWAALGGVAESKHCHALDTGCAWGHKLTAMRLEDQQRFSVSALTNSTKV